MDATDEFPDENTHLKTRLSQIEAENSKSKSDYERVSNANTQLVDELIQTTNEIRQLNNINAKLSSEIANAMGKANTHLENELVEARKAHQLDSKNVQLNNEPKAAQ
jgi:predicted RNase H-like nuclease (RuvC/YqgF family)